MSFRSLTPIQQRRLRNFRRNRRGFWSLWVFLALFGLSLVAEVIANDSPLVVSYKGELYFPVVQSVPEETFGGFLPTEADYRDPFIADEISANGWMVWPPIRFSYNTINYDLEVPSPAPPSAENWLGTDDQGRDVAARVIYGFRISVLFGLTLTIASCIVGVIVGAIQGFYGGKIDLLGQRFIEIWSGLPVLYLLIILSSIVQPNFWWLLGIMLLFSWMGLVFRHILPNAMVATLTFLPFILTGAITGLTSLDFLGFGLPSGSPSLGELIAQGKANLHAPWLGISAFVSLSLMLTLLVFVGEAVRDAFDPRKS